MSLLSSFKLKSENPSVYYACPVAIAKTFNFNFFILFLSADLSLSSELIKLSSTPSYPKLLATSKSLYLNYLETE